MSVLAASFALTVLAWRFRGERDAAARRAERRWLVAAWLAALVIVAVPLANVGAPVSEGVAYRAYFSADLMTHLSVVSELQKGEFPLQNPFYAGDRLGYYWLFFVFPATFGGWATNQSALLIVYVGGGLLFSGLLYAVARSLELSPARAVAATGVLLAASSYEGIVAFARAEPWTDVNVDAVSRWVFELVSLDGLHRSLLYTPQHLFSYSLLAILILLLVHDEPKRMSTAVLAGVLLGGMAGTSIVTAMLAGPWLVIVLWRRRGAIPFLALASVATLTSLGFLAWYVSLGFFGDAGAALTWRVPRLLELPSILVLDAGALVLLVLLRRERRKPFDVELAILAGMALVAVLFLDLRGYEGVWMAWRAGSVLLVALGLLAIRDLRWVHAAVVAPAVLTVVLDVYNASDVSNRRPSPGGFPWTTVVRTEEHAALAWVRDHAPADAVVQWDVRARHAGEWALIPALGERRMAVGFPIFLLDLPKYRVRERRHVRPIFASGDAAAAHRLAHTFSIDYLIVGRAEIRVRGERVRPLFGDATRFRLVFESGETTVLEVLAP